MLLGDFQGIRMSLFPWAPEKAQAKAAEVVAKAAEVVVAGAVAEVAVSEA